MANHTAAIHVLKSKLRLSDDDYRALIKGLTLKTSSLLGLWNWWLGPLLLG